MTGQADPRAALMDLLHASLVTPMLVVAVELDLPGLLADGARPVDELAADAGALPGPLYRVMRALATVGIFDEVAPRVFAPTPLSEALRGDEPRSVRHWVRLWGLPERHSAFGALVHSVRTGEPAFDHVHGRSWWDYLSADPGRAEVFGAAMGDLSRTIHAAAVGAYDLSGVRRLVDVGGGMGGLLSTILPRYPELRGTLFDRPDVIAEAKAPLAGSGTIDRLDLVAGDFFQDVPAGGDAYLLSMILHDWNDEQAVTVLRNIRRAMDPAGRVLIIDAVVPEDGSRHDGKLRDIIMLALHPGRERTEREFAGLLELAGFTHRETRAVRESTGLIVATAA